MLPKPSGSWTFLLSGSYVTRLALPTVSDPLGRKADGCQGGGLMSDTGVPVGFLLPPDARSGQGEADVGHRSKFSDRDCRPLF